MKVPQRMLLTALLLLLLTSFHAQAAEKWQAVDGRMTFHFYTETLERLGIYLTDVEETRVSPPPPEMNMESPYWSFDITEASDLVFTVEHGVAVPYELLEGGIHQAGGLTFEVEGVGAYDLRDFVVEYVEPYDDGPGALHIRNSLGRSLLVIDLDTAMLLFMDDTVILGRMDVRISGDWAEELNRPDLADRLIGLAEVYADAELIEGSDAETVPYVPNFADDDGDIVDVKLGALSGIDEVGREGVFPDGISGITMATTSCNVGTVDVPWLAPMEEDHPGIGMALFREMDTGTYTTFEQVGFSDVKHGFFALSNSQCTPCQHPSGGDFLGVGCSDTYGQGNNADRTWLGPRDEWNPFAGTWECTGSHFSGGQNDCVRRHGGSGHDAVEHRLQVADSDLDNENSTYYYEALYIVRDDDFKMNNAGSRITTMTWQGSGWNFNTPAGGNDLVEGPALLRWNADLHTWANAADDGSVILSVKATDIGLGFYHYEYALYNFDSDRRIRSITLPINAATNVNGAAFHDGDMDDANEWTIEQDAQTITFKTSTYQEDPDANALMFGWLFNFRFNADAPPQTANATLGLFKPGIGDEILAETMAPGNASSVGDGSFADHIRLFPSRPNPLNPHTTIRFSLKEDSHVKLDVYDAAGRRVRTLVDGALGGGVHSMIWDGTGESGRRVGSGIYYYLLRAGREKARQSVVVVQ